MILEVALLDVTPGTEQAFRDAYAQGRGLVEASSGWRSMRMTQGRRGSSTSTTSEPARRVMGVHDDDHLVDGYRPRSLRRCCRGTF